MATAFKWSELSVSHHNVPILFNLAPGCLHVHPKVSTALANGQAVVALESTIVTHGMPYPDNLRTAQEVERIVEQTGATPATVAILGGRLHVGLAEDQLEGLATTQDAIKTSRRDLAWVMSRKRTGGTTVSATMIAAHMAGIPIFVTGGIGGVHRGGETSMDVSADLLELGQTPVTVVSAGVKSILDIPRTLEYLETQGVTVATYGDSTDFPAFFSRSSGVKSHINVRTAKEAAEMIDANLSLGLGSGMLIAVPIPEEYAADGELIEGAIQDAVSEASEQGIVGKDITPFILSRVNELTEGKSLKANMALIRNNAKVGSLIARELSSIRRGKGAAPQIGNTTGKRSFSTHVLPGSNWGRRYFSSAAAGRPLVIGASIVDYNMSPRGKELQFGGLTNEGTIEVSYGGVGRNLADALTRLGANPAFLSAVGTDLAGEALRSNCSHMDFSLVSCHEEVSTAAYCAMLDKKGELVVGLGDMEINSTITPEYIAKHEATLSSARFVCMDGNIPAETIQFVSALCHQHRVPLWFEPTCVVKSAKVCRSDAWKTLTYASPNFNELRSMYAALEGEETINFQDDPSFTDKLRECLQLSRVLLRHVYCLIITLGEEGILVCRNAEPEDQFVVNAQGLDDIEIDGMFSAVHYPAATSPTSEGSVVSVSGAGDCLAAGIVACMLSGHSPDVCLKAGLLAGERSLRSPHAVPATLGTELTSPDFILEQMTFEPSRLQ
ncbi:uncharacterized protein [Diadema antillarum]|uniref:uncharacterized protein n=1 Tax=Diadema antillarum TaxID=105358 RepID=UPI003A89B1C6